MRSPPEQLTCSRRVSRSQLTTLSSLHALEGCREASSPPSLAFFQEDMPYYRRRIIVDIINNKVS
jgi:hypothetical protein